MPYTNSAGSLQGLAMEAGGVGGGSMSRSGSTGSLSGLVTAGLQPALVGLGGGGPPVVRQVSQWVD